MSPLICDYCGAHDYDPQNQNLICKVCNTGHMRDDGTGKILDNVTEREAIAREVWDRDSQYNPNKNA